MSQIHNLIGDSESLIRRSPVWTRTTPKIKAPDDINITAPRTDQRAREVIKVGSLCRFTCSKQIPENKIQIN